MAFSCVPQLKPSLYDYPVGQSLLQQLLKLHTSQNQIHGEKVQRNSASAKQKIFTTKDIIKTNRSTPEDMKPKSAKPPDKMEENTYKTKIVVSDTSENSSAFFGVYRSSGVSNKVQSPQITESDTSNASTKKIPWEDYKGELKISGKEHIYNKSKKEFYLNPTEQPATLVSEITKEIVMTVSKKLETFAFSRKTFSNCTQISSTPSAHLGQIIHQSGCTNRSLLKEGKCETCSVQQLSLNDQQSALDQLSEVNEMNQIVLKVNHPGLKLSDCIRDILMSILGSILKQLDQNNSLKISSRHMLSMQEGRILRTLVSSVLNDVSLGIRDAILPTARPAISEKESQLEGNLNDPYCPPHTVLEPKPVDTAQFSCDHEKVIENPAFDTPNAMSDTENKHNLSMKVIDIPCTLDNDSSQSSGKLSSESDTAQDNALREQEVKASKMKIRTIMKTTEYVANDMLAKILADGEFPLKTDTCKTQTQPFSEKNVFLFVMRNVESILKLLSLAFNYNIVSRTIDISGVFTSPFMGLCADMKVFKENLTDEIHEVPNEYTVKLQSIMGIKRTDDGKDKKAGCSVVEELYTLFIQLIMDELELFLTQKSRSNIVKSRKKTGNPIKEKAIVRVPVLQIFSNKDMPVTQYKLPQGEEKYSHNLINTSEVSHTVTETGATTALVHSKLYIFAKTFINTLLIGIKNSALKENQKKAAGVITSVSDNDGIIRICALILETVSTEKDANRDSDPIHEKPANQKTGSLDSTASSKSNHNEKEKVSSSSLRMSNDSSGTSPSPLQANNGNENDYKLGLCCLKRVSRLSKADAIVCVKKMFPVIQAVKQIVSENLDKIAVDIKLMDPCHCKKIDADSLFPVNDVISFTIDITETMLKMLSVAFEQVGVFHGATKGHFIGLCAELRLLKIDIDCHTSFAEVDRSFVNTFAEKSQTQDPLKHDTSIITLNEIGQHLVYMISKKFACFIQVHCRHDSSCKRAKNDRASDPPFYVSLLPKLYPYAREISEFMFNLINKTLYEEEKKSAPKCVVKRIDDKVTKKQTGTTCSELTDAKLNGAVKIVKLQEPHKAVKEAGNGCGNGTDVCVTYDSLYCEEDLQHESECAPPGTLGEDNFTSLGYDSNSVLTEFQNIASIVFEHVISKLEDETQTQQSSQVIQMVKQIVNDIFQMYSVNLLLPHIYNTSYNINISEAILKLTTQDADTFVSKDEIVFLYSDIISIIFEKLHSAFICATEAKAATGCKEYHHPALGKFTVEQIDNPHEQSFKNWLCRQEIFAEMTNNSNNKKGHIFQKGQYGRNIKSSTPCSGLTDQFADGVLQMVTDRVESFVAMKVESVFCHANYNTNMSARTSTYAGVPQTSHLKEQESQRRMYTNLTINGSEFAETVVNLVVKQTSDFTLKFNVSDNSTPYSFRAGNTGTIVEKVKLRASIPDNPWSALSVPVSFQFSSISLKDITTSFLKAIFCLHGNNVSCTKRERMLSDSDFHIIATHLRNRVLCDFSKNQMWNISRSNCLKAKMDIQKAAESVHRGVLETYRSLQARQATFGTNSGDIVERLSKAIILKMSQLLHPFVSEDLADRIYTTTKKGSAELQIFEIEENDRC